MWTANSAGSISRVRLSDNNVATFTSGFSQPVGITYDGAFLWVTNQGNDTLTKVNPANGAVAQTVGVGNSPSHPVFDGNNIWVPNFGSDSVTVVRASDGTVLGTFTGNGLAGPRAAAFDGERILITNTEGGVSLWKATDLTPLGTVSVGTGTSPYGACSDGLNFWISLEGTGQIARF